jgi:hypothetical protein
MIRPYQLVNRYVDFPTLSSVYSFTVPLFFTDTGGVSGTSRAINYYLNIVNNNTLGTPTTINALGLPVTSNSYITTNYTVGNNFGATFTRNISGVGLQQDQISLYRGSDPVFNVLQQYDTGIYNYGILQAAVPITIQRNQTTNAIIGTLGNNNVIVGSMGAIYRLDKSTNRGDQVNSVWQIWKFDPIAGTTPVPAIAGTDYVVIAGTLTSDVIDIQFINFSVNMQVRNIATGFTMANNPYYNFANDTTSNTAINTTIFQLVTTSIFYKITYPILDVSLSVPSDVLIGTVPFSTYQGQMIGIQAEVLANSGIYNQVNGSVTTPITKTATDWQTIMTTDCNVVLNISDKVTGTIYQTLNGFGPYSIALPNVNNYNFQYATSLATA